MVGQQLDARAGRAVGLGGSPTADLGEERLGAGFRVGDLELAADLEQRQQRAVALASLLAGRHLVGLEVERPRQACRRAAVSPSAVASGPPLARSRRGARPTRRLDRTPRSPGGSPGRLKNRSPRSWNGTPAARNAASKPTSWPFVRTRTAIASAGTPSAISRRASPAIARSSSSPVANWRTTGSGPAGRVATRRLGGPSTTRCDRASRRLASSRTCGLER